MKYIQPQVFLKSLHVQIAEQFLSKIGAREILIFLIMVLVKMN